MNKTLETRWVIGKDYNDEYVVVELRGHITGWFFWINTKWDNGKSYRAAVRITGHVNRIPRADKRLHLTRGDAITNTLAALKLEQAHCRRRITDIDLELEIVDKLDTK